MPDLVSIVIPAYDAERSLARAIDSVLGQTYRPVEVLVVDDGSTDGTAALCASYGRRIQYLAQPNRGVSAARNAGIRAARGEYIGFLDADDWYLPDKLAVLVSLLERHPEAGAATCAHIYRSGEAGAVRRPAPGLVLPGRAEGVVSLLRELSRGNQVVNTNTVLIRSAVIASVGLFHEQLRFGEDLEMWARIASAHEWVYVDQPLSVYDGGSPTSVCARFGPGEHGLTYLYCDDTMSRCTDPETRRDFQWWRDVTVMHRLHAALIAGDTAFVNECRDRLHESPFRLETCSLAVRYLPKPLWSVSTKVLLHLFRAYRRVFPLENPHPPEPR